MHVASLELCKTLYELSEWIHYPDANDLFYVVSDENELDNYVATWHEIKELPGKYWMGSYRLPAYDLGYLLRKLPNEISLTHRFDGWQASYYEKPGTWGEADTPEDAAAKLAIELFKQGVLKK